MSIKDVCNAITERLSNIEEGTLENAESALASWIGLIDKIDHLPKQNDRLQKVISDTTVELFKDINISLILSVSGHYGAACVLARGCIEKSIYILYFIDHPMSAFEWAENDVDLSFSSISEQMSVGNYFELATGAKISNSMNLPKILSELRKTYRQYSESVHGKYKFTETHKGKTVVSKEYYSSIISTADILSKLIDVRTVGGD